MKTNKVTLCWPNRIDQSEVSGGEWTTSLPLSNIKDRVFSRKARSIGVTAPDGAHLLLDGTAGTFAETPSTNALAPQRENLLARSEELDAAVWVKNFVTVTANQATDSLGNLTLDKVEVAAGNDGNPWVKQSPFGAPLNGVQLTAGLELKAGNISRAIVQFFVDGGGAVTHTAASIISGPGTISGVGTGAVIITGLSTTEVTKISLTGTPSFSSGDLRLYIKPQNTTVNVGDFIHAGRVQMNRGATLHQYTQTLANRITEDLEIEADIAADDYTPGALATITSQRDDGAAVATAHQLRILTDGRVQLLWVNPDAPSIFITDNISTVPIGAVDGSRIKVRASLDVDNGAGGHDVKFFVNDVQLGATVTTAGITCFQSPLSTPLRVGALGAGEPFKGKIYRAEVRYGIGAVPRAVFDAKDGKHQAASFVSSETGETWTMQGNASIFVVQTRMQIDLDKGRPIGVVAIAAHNFAPDATVRARLYLDYGGQTLAYDSGNVPAYPSFFQFEQLEWEDNAFWLGTNTLDPTVDYTRLSVIFPDQVYLGVRRIDIDIVDVLNPAGYVEIGRVLVANAFQPELNSSYGITFGHMNETASEVALDGTEYFDRRRQRRTTEFVFENVKTNQAFDSLYALQRDMGIDKEVLFAYETQDSLEFYYRTFIGRLQRLNDISHPYANRWDVPLSIQEII